MTTTAGLELHEVTKTYPGAHGAAATTVLDRVSLTVADHEFVCLVGPSGCGKTTLLNFMAGFDRPSSGTVSLGGEAVTGPGPQRVMVFQDYALFPWLDVTGNVEYGLRIAGVPRAERRRRTREALDLVGLGAHATQAVYRLSGGMRQRVALARALVLRPQVLLMDEPFAALDAQQRGILQQETLRVWQETGQTIVFVTHSLEESLILADRVVLLDPHPGRVAMIVDVDLPRPRDVTSARFNDLRRSLDDRLHAGAPALAAVQ
jgi:NitT/TauT family transport system ATP-binding protein